MDSETAARVTCTDLAFITSRPPDVPCKNRIVAVCGIYDCPADNDAAAPYRDGFILSDFYLFYHLLFPTHTHSTNQIWLTAESAEGLVEKYTEYAHGSPRGERRVVLDASFLPLDAGLGSMRVVEADMLLDRFVETVREQARLSVQNDETLILLIFAHGQGTTGKVLLGGNTKTGKPHLLSMDVLKRTLPKEAKVTLMMTSCYSGSWLVQPSVQYATHLNVTGVAWSGPSRKTRSWAVSKSLGRACGTSVASALLHNLISIEETDEAEGDALEDPTYISFCDAIYQKAKALDRFSPHQQVYFSAQDDEWETQWAKRTGAPLAGYKARWEALRVLSRGDFDDSNPASQTASYRETFLHREYELRAREYCEAKPGPNNVASNVSLHATIGHFFGRFERSIPRDKLRLEYDLARIKGRLAQMGEVDELIVAMALDFPSCLTYSWEEDYHPDPALDKKVSAAFHLVANAHLIRDFFNPHFYKPIRVLAIALAQNCETEAEMMKRIEIAQDFKAQRDEFLLPRVGAAHLLDDPEVQAETHSLAAAMRALGHRVRVKINSQTPSHRGYQAVPQA
ncbi:uncharacterized protein DSM5745_08869 [Aspergillus mulundensis]|uniref:Uncharacterized protein n=1 Tax=Aspergillus mulundensis TaxID=1810919 RepID=A0A3D8R506_9EURO|nr:hypothetical protein DSM5745_08869 [Aspergillus mulundensis]RDW69109.1 hypothetical protein DSM5745_08869 [Aspergillus mulundensis]